MIASITAPMEALCDELLLHICKYLHAFDLVNIAKASPRFRALINERRLWRWINCMPRLSTTRDVDFFNDKVHNHTVAYLISSNTSFLSRVLMYKWKAFNMLSVLALENQDIDSELVTLCDFPPTLTELSLNKCSFTHYYLFFQYCSYTLTRLRVLTLEYCQTIEEHVLSPLGHLPALEVLSLNGCMSMRDSMVPIMMGFQTGFKALKVLDVRCTGFGDELLRYTTKKDELAEIYLHSYMHFARAHAAPTEKCSRNKRVHDFVYKLTERGFDHYRKCGHKVEEYVPPESHLYVRPYAAKCECGHLANGVRTSTKRTHSPSMIEDAKRRRIDLETSSSSSLEDAAASFGVEFAFADGIVIRGQSRGELHPMASTTTHSHVYLQLAERPAHGVNVDIPVVINRYDRTAFERRHAVAMSALMLRGYPVGDEALDSLRQLRLDLVDVTGTLVTRAGLERLREAMPTHCRIVHELYCRCRPRDACCS